VQSSLFFYDLLAQTKKQFSLPFILYPLNITYLTSKNWFDVYRVARKFAQSFIQTLWDMQICDPILENHPFGHNGQFSVL